jgi:hypothetical protein
VLVSGLLRRPLPAEKSHVFDAYSLSAYGSINAGRAHTNGIILHYKLVLR